MAVELQIGDLIIFKARDDSRSEQYIADLTGSKTERACHVAMVYSENEIIELIAAGVCKNKFEITESGNTAYILRYNGRLDTYPLLSKADDFFERKITFDYSALVLLEELLRTKCCDKDPFLNKSYSRIDHLLKKLKSQSDDNSMSCSQFIYHIFSDSGHEISFDKFNKLKKNKKQKKLKKLKKYKDKNSSPGTPFVGSDDILGIHTFYEKKKTETFKEINQEEYNSLFVFAGDFFNTENFDLIETKKEFKLKVTRDNPVPVSNSIQPSSI